MTYDEFIEGINNPDKIKQIDFYIEGYPKFYLNKFPTDHFQKIYQCINRS